MSEAVVFVPGIMGTQLNLPDGSQVWPPTPLETVVGYNKIDELQRPDLVVGPIISAVSCVKVYRPLQNYFAEMGFSPGGAKDLVEFPYDWRLDLFDLADQLAARIDAITASDIKIVAHSMGGLIARLVLESGKYDGRPWFSKISLFTALATPHTGAPLALGRILGLDATLGISAADFAKFAANPNYPSGYQLLPAPGEDACWDSDSLTLAPLDLYDTNVQVPLGLVPSMMERAEAVHAVLTPGKRPKGIRYFYFAGTGQETVSRINVKETAGRFPRSDMVMTRTRNAGDGTVPMWSALPTREQKQVVINNHTDVFRGTPFKRVFFRLFGIDLGPALEGFERAVQMMVGRHVYGVGDMIDVTLSDEAPLDTIKGTLQLVEIGEDGRQKPDATPVDMADIAHTDTGAPFMMMSVGPVKSPGLYKLRFEGNLTVDEEPVFAVSK